MRIPFKNLTVFAGYVGNDVEKRFTGAGVPVVTLRICSKHSYVDDQGARKVFDEWASAVFYRDLAEAVASRAIGTGSFVHVEGRRQTRKLPDTPGGKPRTVHEIIVTDWHLVDMPDRPTAGASQANEPAAAQAPASGIRGGRDRSDTPAFSDTAGLA